MGTTVSRSVINNICKTFHVNEDWLRDGKGEMFAEVPWNEQIEEFVQSALASRPDSIKRRFVAMLSSLSESDLEMLCRVAEAILGERAAVPTSEPEAPAGKIVPPGYSSREELEAECRAEAEEYYREILEEKRRAASGSASGDTSTSGTA